MATIKIVDPVTRIEGHMGVEITIENNRVVKANCSGTLFRGFEKIMAGRSPWEAPIITQRICGVCPTSHGQAASLALDAAGNRKVPDNGRILRNLVLGADYIQSHILHFYLLAALDYVKGPNKSPWRPVWDVDLRIPETDSLVGNIIKAIEARRRGQEMGTIFAGKMPAPHVAMSGGVSVTPNADNIAKFRTHLQWLIDFIQGVYIKDVEYLGSVYNDYFSIGGGYKNLLAFGVFELDSAGTSKLFKRGIAEAARTGLPGPLNVGAIKESVTYSWYSNSSNNLPPSTGRTEPQYPKASAYSWLKAPRYNNKAFEVGALARMWVNQDYQKGISVMDRHVARAYETLKIAKAMMGWLDQLKVGQPVYDHGAMPLSGEGVGLTEAPRGALGHWVKIASGRISHYQIITPTCWNASPRDNNNLMGPMERALTGLAIKDPQQPIEVLRVIHSFDPCLSCAVHVMCPEKGASLMAITA